MDHLEAAVDDKIRESQDIFDHKCAEMEDNFDLIIKNSNEKMQNNILSAQHYIDEKIDATKSENATQMETIITETVNTLMKSLEYKMRADVQAQMTKLEKSFKV